MCNVAVLLRDSDAPGLFLFSIWCLILWGLRFWLWEYACRDVKAFKKAAESMEKLMDATREELPNTMAAIRLSGMEISDLTTELSDIG